MILWPLLTITTFVTYRQTDRHDVSVTDLAHRADLVKSYDDVFELQKSSNLDCIFKFYIFLPQPAVYYILNKNYDA